MTVDKMIGDEKTRDKMTDYEMTVDKVTKTKRLWKNLYI
jgi:hypothetical protein